MNTSLLKTAFLHALGTFVYVLGVAWFMSNASNWFGQEDKFLTPVLAILFLVVSASITGALVLLRPALMYMDGQKKNALNLFGYTLGFIILFAVVVAFVLATR